MVAKIRWGGPHRYPFSARQNQTKLLAALQNNQCSVHRESQPIHTTVRAHHEPASKPSDAVNATRPQQQPVLPALCTRSPALLRLFSSLRWRFVRMIAMA
jgi:hypothetical protein